MKRRQFVGLRMFLRASGLALLSAVVVAPVPAVADQAPRSAIAVESGVRIATRLNTPRRFYGPVTNLEAVRAMMARPGMAGDVEAVFQAAGLPHLAPDAVRTLRDATALRSVTMAVGTRMEWMAQRVKGKPDLMRNVQWGGKAAFEAYEFVLDDGARGYTFVLPTACANLALAAVGPSPKAAAAEAARAADARRAEAERAEAARRAEEERRAAELKAAEARRAEEAARAEEARRAEAARFAAEEARRAEEARQAAEAAELDRRARVDVFVEALAGKERRVREFERGTTTVVGGQCAALVGGKGGVDVRLGTSGWRLAPAVGVAFNTEESGNSSLFGDLELNYWIGDKGFVGTGAGVWDITHSDTVAGSWLLHAGREIVRSASGNTRLLAVAEGRLFFDEVDDVENNYVVWAGLRVVFR